MMEDLIRRAAAIGAARVAATADALAEAASAELDPDLTVQRQADGIAISGTNLAHRLAFDGRLRGLGWLLKDAGR